ncbi:hypothetical protein [Chitinophaga flava]|uniref:Universal stress protein n=1 Tax=Chitinophaga flava TaxID=2259036 RepID=A0A365XZA0_9BACT|nr:hypothetical protein [Chitinophaga flava]RBL91398.1 hypothetical protein DF182_01905 [Chitinophaga flava]
MEKILLVMCGAAPSNSAVDFACYLSDISHSKLVGCFYKDKETAINAVTKRKMAHAGDDWDSPETFAENIPISSMQTFEDTCGARGIPAAVKYMEEPTLDNILAESRFADLMIVDAPQGNVFPFLQKLLSSAQCPVIIAPRSCTAIDEIVFCYDGSPSAVFAMKQLIYLLPELGEKKATIVHIGTTSIPEEEKKNLAGWLSRHFACSTITTLKDNTTATLSDFLQKKQETMIVMGDLLSGLITPAHPVFITHH